MKSVFLQFETLVALTDFMAVINNVNCEINHQRLTVLCQVSADELQLAISSFGGKIIPGQPDQE
jgi:hypothetical protein